MPFKSNKTDSQVFLAPANTFQFKDNCHHGSNKWTFQSERDENRI